MKGKDGPHKACSDFWMLNSGEMGEGKEWKAESFDFSSTKNR